MSFHGSHLCGFLSYQRAGKLVSGKRKAWGSDEIKSHDWSALCCAWLGWKMLLCAGSGQGSTKRCSLLGLFASVLWVVVTQDNPAQILLPLQAVAGILLLKLLWHADDQRTLLEDWNTHNPLMCRRGSGFNVIPELLHRQVHVPCTDRYISKGFHHTEAMMQVGAVFK